MRRLVLVLTCAVLLPIQARAQSSSNLEIGAGFVASNSSEFRERDFGISGRLGWTFSPWLGVEGEATFFPRDYPDGVAISANRVEGLLGATIGPRVNRWRPFARVRGGFLTFAPAPAPIACVAIFPPPLECVLAAGRTMPAFDLGGGLEFAATDRTLLRLDLGDRVLKYPGPSFSRPTGPRDSFFSHDCRFSIGAGLKF